MNKGNSRGKRCSISVFSMLMLLPIHPLILTLLDCITTNLGRIEQSSARDIRPKGLLRSQLNNPLGKVINWGECKKFWPEVQLICVEKAQNVSATKNVLMNFAPTKKKKMGKNNTVSIALTYCRTPIKMLSCCDGSSQGWCEWCNWLQNRRSRYSWTQWIPRPENWLDSANWSNSNC